MKERTDPGRSAGEGAASGGFTSEERAAMRQRVEEMKRERRSSRGRRSDREDGERAVLAKIAGMNEQDRRLGERVHAIIMAAAPDLTPRLWYGMPAYARNGNVVCHFKDAGKFRTRYATLGFSDAAKLDEGTMWPTEFALTSLTDDDEKRIAALVRRAVG